MKIFRRSLMQNSLGGLKIRLSVVTLSFRQYLEPEVGLVKKSYSAAQIEGILSGAAA